MHSTPDPRATAAVHVADEAALSRLAAVVVEALPSRAFIALAGDLGAGKTTFVKAIAAAAGIDPTDVVSPTFGLIHVHEGPQGRIVHADFYRLAAADELRETGWEDAIGGAAGRGFGRGDFIQGGDGGIDLVGLGEDAGAVDDVGAELGAEKFLQGEAFAFGEGDHAVCFWRWAARFLTV